MKSYRIEAFDGDLNGDMLYTTDRGVRMTVLRRDSHRRTEQKVSGMYILLDSNRALKKCLYIGQSMDISGRMLDHRELKDFWNYILIFTMEGVSLTRTQIEWLEMMCIKRCVGGMHFDCLHNTQVPRDVVVSEGDKALLDEMFTGMKDLLELYGVLELEGTVDITHTEAPKMLKRVLGSYNYQVEHQRPQNTPICDEDGIWHLGGVSYMEIGGRIYVCRGSKVDMGDMGGVRAELFERLGDKVSDGEVREDIMLEGMRELMLFFGAQ